jgi:threonine/homoserine/homoserine lactone efflux protein
LFFKKIIFNEGALDKEKLLSKSDLFKIFIAGFFMNILNPSVFLFWFAWTAAITATASETNNPIFYRIIVFGTCLLFVLFTDLLKVSVAGKLRSKLTLQNMIIINRISGIIILLFSAALFYGALHY